MMMSKVVWAWEVEQLKVNSLKIIESNFLLQNAITHQDHQLNQASEELSEVRIFRKFILWVTWSC